MQEGDWVGIELLKATGKNNGAVTIKKRDEYGNEVSEEKRYFTCEDKKGIFVRPDMVKRVAEEAGCYTCSC